MPQWRAAAVIVPAEARTAKNSRSSTSAATSDPFASCASTVCGDRAVVSLEATLTSRLRAVPVPSPRAKEPRGVRRLLTPGPHPGPDHAAYSNGEMARDAVELMSALGHKRFAVAGHDRGAPVAARLVVDHRGRVSAAMLLDVAPTLDMYEATDRDLASAYRHWFFLIQPAPMPEALVGANPRGYVEGVMGARHAGLGPFPPEVLDEYVACLDGESNASGPANDSRAANGIDLEHDRADRKAGRRTSVPLRVLWARHGVVGRLFGPLALWDQVAESISGRAVDCGHYLPEVAPVQVLAEMLDFFGRT
ncbi:alpha/beta fold hydrolase [Georgenia sp. Z1491]|uniref:alpha/beta fold hydrolase n=1 Tax=Georgenia sp. Z1491 TaxID=3416707 RepID=UPI003CF8C1B2